MSLSRLALAAAFIVASGAAARLMLVAIAGITDALDGWMARRHRQQSAFGSVLDPVADRVFVLVVIGTLIADGTLTWAQTLVLVARDIATTVGAVVVRMTASLRRVPLEARFSGKVVTALQFATLVGAIAAPRTLPWMLGLVAIAAVVSIADYSAAAWRLRAVALSIVLLVASPGVSGAQGFPGVSRESPSRTRVEARADAFAARMDAVHLGVGIARELGTYFRLAGIVAGGAADLSGETVASARVELLGRFVLDPFRQARWGLYGATGLIARYDDGPGTRGYVTLVVGAELPGRGSAVPAVELGIGGGARLGVVVRRARQGRR